MISEELRARISQFTQSGMLRPASMLTARPLDLESLVPGEIIQEGDVGRFYRIRRSITELRATELFELARDHLPPPDIEAEPPTHPALHELARAFPNRAVFLDVETCGFSGAVLFLVGLLRNVGDELIVEQLLARDYTEERAVLQHLWRTLSPYDVLVTFNGKSFDWPFIIDRSVANRLARPGYHSHEAGNENRAPASEELRQIPPTHCDLLHLARRYWKAKHLLPNCRLQTLESVLCGRRRYGDIPGYLVGEFYHRFVRSRDARHVEQVLHHNAVDLLTLAQLALLMVRELNSPHPAESLGSKNLELMFNAAGAPNRPDVSRELVPKS
jgi:uncharacterized protein YprB with RNaseH-like and TPR domain